MQSLFRENCGFCVFHVIFEPQTPLQIGSWEPSEVETRPRQSSWEPLDPAEARGEQACPVTAAGQAGKEDFLGASGPLWLEARSVRRQGGAQEVRGTGDKTGQLCGGAGVYEPLLLPLCGGYLPPVLGTCHLCFTYEVGASLLHGASSFQQWKQVSWVVRV